MVKDDVAAAIDAIYAKCRSVDDAVKAAPQQFRMKGIDDFSAVAVMYGAGVNAMIFHKLGSDIRTYPLDVWKDDVRVVVFYECSVSNDIYIKNEFEQIASSIDIDIVNVSKTDINAPFGFEYTKFTQPTDKDKYIPVDNETAIHSIRAPLPCTSLHQQLHLSNVMFAFVYGSAFLMEEDIFTMLKKTTDNDERGRIIQREQERIHMVLTLNNKIAADNDQIVEKLEVMLETSLTKYGFGKALVEQYFTRNINNNSLQSIFNQHNNRLVRQGNGRRTSGAARMPTGSRPGDLMTAIADGLGAGLAKYITNK